MPFSKSDFNDSRAEKNRSKRRNSPVGAKSRSKFKQKTAQAPLPGKSSAQPKHQQKSSSSSSAEALSAAALTKVQLLTIDEDSAGQRIDNFLFRQFRAVPKSRLYRAMRDGEIRVNKKRVKPAYKLQTKDIVRLPPLRVAEKPSFRASDHILQQLEQAIIFENADLIVVNKPSGLAVHGGSGIQSGLIEVMRQLRPECKRLELVHRLDRDTSGCTMIAKKASVLRYLHQQLREKTLSKHNLALVKGRWPVRKTLVNLALEKNIIASGERMVRPSPEGKVSKTGYRVVETLPQATLVEVSPITGRTHQIRVHSQASGHPILGDSKYGIEQDTPWHKSIGLERLFLHAAKLEFFLPNREEAVLVEAELPADLKQVLRNLRNKGH